VPLDIHSAPLAKLLPNVLLTVIPGAGHMPHHSHAEVVIAAIDRAALR
jgi:pimeloyl-ACP methyl ester carboxylesterase